MATLPDPGKSNLDPDKLAELLAKHTGIGISGLGLIKATAPEPVPTYSDPLWNRVAGIAVLKGLLEIKDLPAFFNKFGGYPDTLEQVAGICEKASEKFSIVSKLHSALLYREAAYAREYLNLTHQYDLKVIDHILEASNDRHFSSFGKTTAERVANVAKLIDRFTEYLPVGEFRHWKIDLIKTILDRSAEPKTDLEIVTTLTSSFPHRVTAADLVAYYSSGFRYFWHKEAFGLDYGTSKVTVQEAETRKLFARLPKPVPPAAREPLIKALIDTPTAIQEHAVKLVGAFYEHELPMSFVTSLIETCKKYPVRAEQIDLLSAALGVEPSRLPLAIAATEEVIRLKRDDVARYHALLRDGDLAGLEQALYRERLEEHARKFPEKDLGTVFKEFSSPATPGAEAVSEDTLLPVFADYRRIVTAGERLKPMSKLDLVEEIAKVMQTPIDQRTKQEFRIEFFALARELFKHTYGVYPYNTQLITALLLLQEPLPDGLKGRYAEVKTGEGKSLLFSFLAAYRAACGRNVDVITSNSYLAGRDALKFEAFFKPLGISVGSFAHSKDDCIGTAGPAVLYTTNQDLVFSYLLCKVNFREFFKGKRLDCALVDEADNLCIDLTHTSMRIAGEAEPLFLRSTFEKMISFVDAQGHDWVRRNLPAAIASFRELDLTVASLDPLFLGMYLESAIHSAEVTRNVDYIVKDDKVTVVDVKHTGRVMEKTKWSHGLHESVALREIAANPDAKIQFPESMGLLAQLSHPAFVRMYKEIQCVSGTFGDTIERDEIRSLYSLEGFDVPTHLPNRRQDGPMTLVNERSEWLARIGERVRELKNDAPDRPVLIVTGTIADSRALAAHFESLGIRSQLMNDVDNSDDTGTHRDEEYLIGTAGRAGTVTVATSVAGRGADIIPDAAAVAAGGVHVIVGFIADSVRVERQAKGRAARQGMDGSSEVIACLQDDRFFESLPHVVQSHAVELRARFGEQSTEIEKFIQLVRQSKNVLDALGRKVIIERERLSQHGLDRYLESTSHATASLRTMNKAFAQNEGLGEALASMFMSARWSRLYSDFDTRLGHRTLRVSDDLLDTSDSPGLAQLADAFERTFGCSFATRATNLDPDLVEVLDPIVAMMCRMIARSELQMQQLTSANITDLLEELNTRVCEMTAEFVDEFKGKKPYEIQRYLDAEDAKRREKRAKDEDRK